MANPLAAEDFTEHLRFFSRAAGDTSRALIACTARGPKAARAKGTDVASTSKSKNGFSVTVYQGDFKTLLAFNLASKAGAKNLAGFTVQTQPREDGVLPLQLLSIRNPG